MKNQNTTRGPAPRTFFTSDTHFGHANIIKYCNRPFGSAEEMDQALIERHNATVGDEDIVFNLGDFTFKDATFAGRIFRQLKGRIRVLGNHWHHDARWLPPGFGPSNMRSRSGHPVEILPPMAVETLRLQGRKQLVVLCHYPIAEWDRQHHGSWHLHGHSHGRHVPRGRMLDVGVDCHDFTPVPTEALSALVEREDAA